MIKKLISTLVAAAIIAIMVIVVLRRDNFRSMILRDELPSRSAPAAPKPIVAKPAIPVDSLAVKAADSI